MDIAETSERLTTATADKLDDDDLPVGSSCSLDVLNNDANALPIKKTEPEECENKTAFFTLKERRKGLIFQSIRKSKGVFDVTVQLDYIKYFGKGKTQTNANNACASTVLAALDSGEHKKNAQELYNNSFNTLKGMYNNLLYQTLAHGTSDKAFEVYVNVDGIDYFGEGKSIREANNDTAWEALKSIWSGEHKRQLDDLDDYWYDDDTYSTTGSSSDFCFCSCHYCSCCC